MNQGQNIQVFVRCRPPTPSEGRSVIEVSPTKKEVRVIRPEITRNFIFDQVFPIDSEQIGIYNKVVAPLIDQVLQGYNCTVFAYGQTGTGKTYTMEGNRSQFSWETDPESGLIPRAINQLFDSLEKIDNEFTVGVSFLEIHNEDTYDLLSPISSTTKLKIFDDANKKGTVIVSGLEEVIVRTKAEIYDILQNGSAKRQTAATILNACSSRSHSVFSITVHVKESTVGSEDMIKKGKLNLVDLAGSENIGRSGAQEKRAREAGNINQSLLTLGRVITALVEKRPHVPYRESKLTRLLQDSLGGKTKTAIIATISPSVLDLEDTLSTLDYASRAKKVTNKPEANQKMTKKAFLREYSDVIESLRRDLRAARDKNGVYIDHANYEDMCKKLSANNSAINEQEERVEALQKELGKKCKLFEDFSLQYEKTKQELEKSKLHCERQKRLLKIQKELREKLAKHSEHLQQVAEMTTTDINLLQNKKDRMEKILKENRESIDRYQPELSESIIRYGSILDMVAQEYDSLFKEFQQKGKKTIAESTGFVARVAEHEKTLADKLVNQSANLQNSVENLRNLSQSCQNQAEHYRTMATECERQSKCYQKEIEDRLQLANDLKERADHILIGKTIYNNIENLKTTFELDCEDNSKKFELVSTTLNSTMRRELGTMNQSLETFLTRSLKSDVQTGNTPQRKTYDIPRRLANMNTSFQDTSITEECEEEQEEANALSTPNCV